MITDQLLAAAEVTVVSDYVLGNFDRFVIAVQMLQRRRRLLAEVRSLAHSSYQQADLDYPVDGRVGLIKLATGK